MVSEFHYIGLQKMQKRILTWIVIVLFLSSCSVAPQRPISQPEQVKPDQEMVMVVPNSAPGEGPEYQSLLEEFSIISGSGNSIYGLIRRPDPDLYPAHIFAAVIKIPGGINPGRSENYGTEAIALAEAGMVVVTFNAEGRVDELNPDDLQSEGVEDYNGFRNQDTLAEIFRFVMELPYVDQNNIGLRSQSYGITMAAGCASRHPDLPIKYLIDGEGPPDSYTTVHEPWAQFSPENHPNQDKYETVFDLFGHYSLFRDSSQDNQVFWQEREALRFIGDFRGHYLRLQGEWDHSQPPGRPAEAELFDLPPSWWQGKHTCDIVNAAIRGGVPWVRVNMTAQGNQVNMACDYENMPVFIPGELNDQPMIPVLAVLEMARMENP